MIYFDVTKAAGARHRSGLLRVSARLREELGPRAMPVVWRSGWRNATTRIAVTFQTADWLVTPELFSEAERPGFWKFLQAPGCRLAAIFHDAIPLKFPQITWPQSVARHPEYMKMLARFDRVWAVSKTSLAELVRFWTWQGAEVRASAEVITLGADFQAGLARGAPSSGSASSESPVLLSVGIIEPRKNQSLLADVAEVLARERLSFQLNVLGRVNPHFGRPIEERLREIARNHPQLRVHTDANDVRMLKLWRTARATVFPTLTEGCGLPLLESLWMGVPCICSDLPVLRETGEGGGCAFVPVNDEAAWVTALRRLLLDQPYAARLREEAISRVLPTWRQAADWLISTLT